MAPETLASTLSAHNSAMHYRHCFSQIRQYIMCAGDMTPIPTKYYPAIGRTMWIVIWCIVSEFQAVEGVDNEEVQF
jgi:hypothetical protein